MFARVAPCLLVTLVVLLPACRFDAPVPGGLTYTSGADVPDDLGTDSAGDALPEQVEHTPGDGVLPDTIPGDGTGDDTPSDAIPPDSCNCDDGIACTMDSCIGGKCEHQPDDSLCQKGSECLTWHCDPLEGCQMEAHTGKGCSNSDLCATNPHCNEKGECVHDGIKPCPDQQCLKGGSCQPLSGECTYEDVLDGPGCDDSNPCTDADECKEGVCQGIFVPEKCKCSNDAECSVFEDGDLCNGTLLCLDGLCQVDLKSIIICPQSPSPCIAIEGAASTGECKDELLGPEKGCDDSNPCTSNDKCDGSGVCKGAPLQDGSACNTDDSLCTVEACKAGACQSKEVIGCPALPQCVENVCQPKSGKCVGQAWPDGTACDDGDKCTKGESCANGTCQGGFDVCVDCGKTENAGHPCDDGQQETVGDFCFNLKCAGWLDATWSIGTLTQTGLTRVSSTPDLVHFTGLHDKGDPAPTVYFVNADGKAKLQVTNLAIEQPGADLDGPVAVGPPSALNYYSGGSFQWNSSFKNEVKKVCTGMGDAYRPRSVVQRNYTTIGGVKPGFSEMVAVGFEIAADIAPEGACLVVLCGRNEGPTWVCNPLRPKDVQLGTGLLHPAVTALWLPEQQGTCDSPTTSCFEGSSPHIAASLDKQGGGRFVKVFAVKGDDDVTQPILVPLVEKDYGANEAAPTIRSIRLDNAGNLYVAGSQAFLAVRAAATGKVTFFPKFVSLGQGTPHYEGIYLNSNGTLLAANVAATKTGADGKDVLEIRSGLVAGPPSLLLEGGGAMPFFNQVYKVETCVDCPSGPLGPLGLTDLAAVKDHLGNVMTPGQLPFILVLSATVPDPVSGLLRGHGLFLPL
ncbi:MAG: hypothetical protein FJ109_15260 [Deltaproteobacteria bacterium]|nr:hypothetical protein [Deltaproteobacteria bacterium]